jgi:hypothetical protein
VTAPSPEVQRALDALKHHDRPHVDADAMLKQFMARTAPITKPFRWAPWVAAAGLCVAALVTARVVSPRSPHHKIVTTPVVEHVEIQQPSTPQPVVEHHAAPSPPEVPVVAVAPPVVAHAQPQRVHTIATAPTADEWGVLRDVNQALQSHNHDRALRLLDQHAHAHPRSAAMPEAMAYRVRAHCMAGNVSVATAVARELRALAPSSPAAYSLRTTCAADGSH